MASKVHSIWIKILVVMIVGAAHLTHGGNYVPYDQDDVGRFKDDILGIETTMKVNALPSSGWRLLNDLPGIGPLWVWTRPNIEYVYIWSTVLNTFQLLANFQAPAGSTYQADLAACNQGEVVLAARGLTLQTPAGVFEEVVQLDFHPNCADGGVTRMWFAPRVGIVRVTELNIVGVLTHDLIEAEVGGVTFPRPSGLDISAKFPSPLIVIDREPPIMADRPPTSVAVSLSITNHTNGPLDYLFRDGQRFDIFVINADGEVVSTWSRGRGFPDVVSVEVLEAGQSWRFRGNVPLTNDKGSDLPAGGYTLRIEMTSDPSEDTAHTPGSRRISSTTPLQIRWAL